MRYWKIVGASIGLRGDVLDTLIWNHSEQRWRRNRGDDGEHTTFYDEKTLNEHLELARQYESPTFLVWAWCTPVELYED